MSATRHLSADAAEPSFLGPARDWGSSLLLLATWGAAASTAMYAIYSVHGVVILGIVAIAVLVAMWFGVFQTFPPSAIVVVLAVGAVAALIVTPPFINVAGNGWLAPAAVLGGVATISSLVVFWGRFPAGRLAVVPLVLGGVAFAGMIVGGVPNIDVWVIFQQSADGLLHGLNPYNMSFSGVPAGQTSNCFNYLPVTFLATAPSKWLFGDVRWIEGACVLATGALLTRHVVRRGSGRGQVALAALVALTPGSLLVVQQAWNEPILVLGLVASAVLMERGRWNWAMLPFGLALATKQHLVLLLPLLLFWPKFGWRRVLGTAGIAAAVSLPWLVANPARFTQCTASFFLGEQAPPKALSIWRILPQPMQLPVLIVGLVLAFGIAVWRCPKTPAGFLVSAGTVFVVFDLVNKQTFVNQWWLAAMLLVSGIVLGGRTLVPGAVDGELERC
ncbi:MAG TPA: hypothetical protein VJ914_08020 [Pseudonocardiaceae bacterium]|nr:hypothetical protein [Pseudonocardiaceae bacterium]